MVLMPPRYSKSILAQGSEEVLPPVATKQAEGRVWPPTVRYKRVLHVVWRWRLLSLSVCAGSGLLGLVSGSFPHHAACLQQ